jgi:hypothetical protein
MGSGGAAGRGGAGGAAGQDGAPLDARPDGDARIVVDSPPDVPPDCGTPGVIHTTPNVPSGIAVPSGVTLLAGFRGSGNQIYTCVANPSDGGDAATGGTYANTATATLYGDNCTAAVTHTFTSTPGSPRWLYNADGSAVVGARVNAVPAPTSGDAGDAGPSAIAWLLLRAASNSGEGYFTNVTYIQRVDTVGGVGPSGSCDPTADSGTVIMVPYSATYYFYTGTSDAGTAPDATVDSSADSGVDVTVTDVAVPIDVTVDIPTIDTGLLTDGADGG